MLALVRPDSWNFPLFLHVLGAIVLVGAVAATVATSASSQQWPWLRPIVFWTVLTTVIPAWLLMRLAGQWTDSREPIGDGSGWLNVGYIVGDAGLVLLLLTAVVSWIGKRRPERHWPGETVAVIATIYLAGLLVAMFAMSGKPGS
jgi:NADH:ubiquinone oxidoreductase subunit 6 (subunit J)